MSVLSCHLPLCMVLAVAPLPAQAKAAARQAQRLVTFLELPNRRDQAIADLLRMGPKAVGALTRALDDPRQEIVFMAMRILRALGPDAEAALERLRELEKSEDLELAHAAAWARSRLEPVGITLVADYNRGAIREFDAKGKELFTLGGLGTIRDVERLVNGNFLITDYIGNRVREITRKGKEVWSFAKLHGPMDADRLPNGNTLIVLYRAGAVREIDPKGKTVMELKSLVGPFEAHRLANGNTLVAERTMVREFDKDGKELLRITTGWAATVQRY